MTGYRISPRLPVLFSPLLVCPYLTLTQNSAENIRKVRKNPHISADFFLHFFYQCKLVQLSGHESKNYQAILRAKKRFSDDSKLCPASIVSESSEKSKRAVDGFGELAVKRLQQEQKHFTDEEVVKLAEEYQSGKTLIELAKQYGCHRDTVSRTLKKHGVKVRGRGVRPPQ